MLHELVAFGKGDRTCLSGLFVITRLPQRGDACSSDYKRHSPISMSARTQGSAVIRRNEQTPAAIAGQGFEQGTDDMPVDLFEGPHFGVSLAFVRSLVRGFDVNANQVVIGQRSYAVASFGGIIGVEVAGGSGHIDARPTEQHADAANQIDRAENGALLAVNFFE